MSPFNLTGLKTFLLKLWLLPAFYFLLWIFYYDGFAQGSDVSIKQIVYAAVCLQFFFSFRKITNTKVLTSQEMALFSIAWRGLISCQSSLLHAQVSIRSRNLPQ